MGCTMGHKMCIIINQSMSHVGIFYLISYNINILSDIIIIANHHSQNVRKAK